MEINGLKQKAKRQRQRDKRVREEREGGLFTCCIKINLFPCPVSQERERVCVCVGVCVLVCVCVQRYFLGILSDAPFRQYLPHRLLLRCLSGSLSIILFSVVQGSVSENVGIPLIVPYLCQSSLGATSVSLHPMSIGLIWEKSQGECSLFQGLRRLCCDKG